MKRTTLVAIVLAVFAVAAFVVPLVRDDARPPAVAGPAWVRQERALYVGIPSRLEFEVPAGRDGTALAAAAWAEFDRIGERFNPFSPTSDVGRLNARAGATPAEVSAELVELLDLGRELWTATRKAFDPTVWPLKTLWRDAERTGEAPARPAIAAALERVGLDRVHVDGPASVSFDRSDVTLDFGGIVKGYAVDRAGAILRAAGVASGLVQCGGEIAVWGRSPSGNPWRIGVKDPLDPGKVHGVVSHSGGSTGVLAVSTSGNYEQPVRVGGRDYYHIFDPRSGDPVDTRIRGVTVVVTSGEFPNARADGLATGLVVLGTEAGTEVADGIDGAGALFIVDDGNGGLTDVVTTGMKGLYSP